MSSTHTTYFAVALDQKIFPWACAVIIANLVHFIVINTMGGKHRKAMFSETYMKENFGDEHSKAFKHQVPKGGYPDCGNGVYSAKLSYKEWFMFNLAQRNAKNYLEMITPFIFALIILAIVWPIVSIVYGCANIIFRIIFVILYQKAPKLRSKVGPFMVLTVFGAQLTAIAATIYWQVKISNLA